jgi:hypothetical protein
MFMNNVTLDMNCRRHPCAVSAIRDDCFQRQHNAPPHDYVLLTSAIYGPEP